MKIKNNTPFQVVVNGKTYEAEVENTSASPMAVTVNGTRYVVEMVETGSPVAVPAPVEAAAVAAVQAPVHKPAPTQKSSGGNGFEIKAPMPGTINGICVKVGQAVKFGDQLCLLEAMKMKNAIRAPKEGVVETIEVTNEQKVGYGDLLFTLK